MNTPFLDGAYERIHFDRELVFKFFTIFSLFEYALKQSGYYKPQKRTKKIHDAEPDWGEFTKDIQVSFDPNSSPELKDAVKYFLENPPMKQVIEHGHLGFIPIETESMSRDKKLSIYIRCVRNNLFHGGKISYQRPRDAELIQHAIVILEAWAQLDKKVQKAFIYAIGP